MQEPQLGTGHALLQAEPHLAGRSGTVVLLSGDVPLLRPATLRTLVEAHRSRGAAATVLTARVDRPHGYGRIVRDGAGASRPSSNTRTRRPAERAIDEINSGIYAFALEPLFAALEAIGAANAQGEYYLPDLVKIYRGRGLAVETVSLDDPREIMGVNSRRELADVTAILKTTRNEELMAAGVTLDRSGVGLDRPRRHRRRRHGHPSRTCTSRDGPASARAARSTRRPHRRLDDRRRGGHQQFLRDRGVAHPGGARDRAVRPHPPQSDVGEGAHVGNFVELKKTTLGKGSKANHLSYLGDATIGEKVNIGAGTITCNYDGIAQAPDRHRGRRVHRQRHAAGRAGHGRQGRVRRRRHDGPRGRAARRARVSARQAAQQRRLGREEARR